MFTRFFSQVPWVLSVLLLPILPPQPSTQWASEAPEDVVPIERAGYAPKPEDRPKLYAYIGATIERYKDRNPYWEFLNEPLWVPWYCLPTGAGYSVDTYIELLQGASAAMKAADPDCIVIGGLSITAESTLGDEFIQKGGLEYVDIYNLHPYPTPNQAPERFIRNMQRVLGVMDAQGERKPIWATELGYWATDDKPWRPWTPPNDSHCSANRQQASEREASDYNIRHAVILLAHNVDKIFWHSGTSGELNNGSYDLENPLLDPEAIPQKFYAAQAALAHLLGPVPILDSEFEKPETVDGVSTEGVYGYAFEGPNSSVLVVWAPGQYNTEQSNAGRIVRLGESPVYLTSATMNATQLASACALVRIPPAASGAYNFNGWGAVLSADASVAYPSPFGELTIHTAKATDGASEVRWETQVAPEDITGGNHIFKWLGATGYDSEPEGTFALYLGETKLLDFEVALTSTTWTSDDGAFRLDYRPFKTFNEGEDSAGVMTLTVPASMLTPGEKAQLRVVGGDSESQRWFGIYESADGAMTAPSWALELPEGVNAYSVVGTPLLEEEQTALASLVGSE